MNYHVIWLVVISRILRNLKILPVLICNISCRIWMNYDNWRKKSMFILIFHLENYSIVQTISRDRNNTPWRKKASGTRIIDTREEMHFQIEWNTPPTKFGNNNFACGALNVLSLVNQSARISSRMTGIATLKIGDVCSWRARGEERGSNPLK